MSARPAVLAVLCVLACGLAAAPAAGRLADPTRPPGYGGDGQFQRPWNLTSILVSPRRRLAVINGEVVREGGRIDGMTVIRIRDDRVILKGLGGRETVPLVVRPVKTPAHGEAER